MEPIPDSEHPAQDSTSSSAAAPTPSLFAGAAASADVLFERLAARLHDGLANHLGIQLVTVRPGFLLAQLEIAPQHMAANGYLHAGTVVTLADTACGFGCFASLPAGAVNFTTLELKSNFLRTATTGILYAEAQLVHGGRRTQVWDATVFTGRPALDPLQPIAKEKPLALFRCTQMLLYPEQRG